MDENQEEPSSLRLTDWVDKDPNRRVTVAARYFRTYSQGTVWPATNFLTSSDILATINNKRKVILMKKYFCDICGDEIKAPAVRNRIQCGRITVDITRALDDVWNDGEICLPCVIAAVTLGELVGEEF